MKKLLFISLVSCIVAYFTGWPVNAVNSCRNGIMLWADQIFPTLFIFIIISDLLINTKILDEISNRIIVIASFVCGCIFGFPMGAKLAGDLYGKGIISQRKAGLLAAASNHFSPVFISAYCLNGCLGLSCMNIPTYIILYTPSVAVLLYLLAGMKKNNKKAASKFEFNIQIYDAAIVNSFEILIRLCGYIVFFTIVTDIFKKFNHAGIGLFASMLEVTNGIKNIPSVCPDVNSAYILCIGLLSMQGLSGLAQTMSILNRHKISCKSYISCKAILTAMSLVLGRILLFFVHIN